MKKAISTNELALPLLAAAQSLTPADEVGYQKLIQSQKGSVVVIDFWATWCKPCRAEMPQLVKLNEKLKARGLKLVTVSSDELASRCTAKKFSERRGRGGPAVVHSNVPAAMTNSRA